MRPSESAARVADLLNLLADAPRGLGVTAISEELGIHKSSASRLLATLAQRGLLQRGGSGLYSLGPSMIRFAGVAMAGLDLVRHAHAPLVRLSQATRETVNLAVLDAGQVLYVDQVTGPTTIVTGNWTGRRSPVHVSSSGKAILAFTPPERVDEILADSFDSFTDRTITDPARFRAVLELVRARGWAHSADEYEVGLSTVAAPILIHGRAVAAVSVSGPTFRIPLDQAAPLGDLALQASRQIEARAFGGATGDPN